MSAKLRSSDDYRAGLRDGRRIYYRGQQVSDVTTHPVLRVCVDHAAIDFDMAHDPKFRELAVTPEGWSRYFQVPRSAEDLLDRSRLIEAGTRQGKTLVLLIREIGTDALFWLQAMAPSLSAEVNQRVRSFFERCRDHDLTMAVGQTDVKGDRSKGPSEQADPDLYLRIVDRRADGIVVRGAKVHTSMAVNSDELIVLPTRAMTEADQDYAVAFATPLNAPGLAMVASPFLGGEGKDPAEHPISARHKMVETLTMFDDVFVPWERVFLAGEWQLAGEVARGFVEFHRFTAISYKLPLVDALVGCGLLAARVNGLERAGHVRDKLAWLVAYAETLRALTHHAAERCKLVNGVAVPDTLLVNIAKLQFAQGLHTAMQYVQDISGGLLVTYPGPEDLAHPHYGDAVRRYLAGAGVDGTERLRVMNLISDLTAGEYGGYQTTLAIHAEGSIEAEKLTILAQYPRDEALAYARWLADLQ
ncbi:MAG: gamma-aminobutyrate dehydratase [Chloroflexi bacterium]|nr:gamma-aminobutyrate dehydratase [Chloroflexota bacterium]